MPRFRKSLRTKRADLSLIHVHRIVLATGGCRHGVSGKSTGRWALPGKIQQFPVCRNAEVIREPSAFRLAYLHSFANSTLATANHLGRKGAFEVRTLIRKRNQTNQLQTKLLTSGPGGRRFKSSLPDHFKSSIYNFVGEQRVYKRVYIAAGIGGVGINSRQTEAAAMLTASTRSSHHVLL